MPSAQVKSAILLAGLAADGETWVTEAVATRDHTERMLRARGVAVDEGAAPDGRHTVRVAGPSIVAAVDETVPADPSAAAFWLVAASIHPDAELRLDGVSTNPTRRAIIDILRRMGADIEEHDRPAIGGADGEPLADLVVRSSALRAVDLEPAEVAAAIDEIPILALAATAATRDDTDPGRRRAPAQGVRPDRRASRPASRRSARTSASRATTSRSTVAGHCQARSPRHTTITGSR